MLPQAYSKPWTLKDLTGIQQPAMKFIHASFKWSGIKGLVGTIEFSHCVYLESPLRISAYKHRFRDYTEKWFIICICFRSVWSTFAYFQSSLWVWLVCVDAEVCHVLLTLSLHQTDRIVSECTLTVVIKLRVAVIVLYAHFWWEFGGPLSKSSLFPNSTHYHSVRSTQVPLEESKETFLNLFSCLDARNIQHKKV